jgi:hypothetical protein
MLSALQMLNVTTLAASVAGVGVSVAGFALVLRRLQSVEQGIDHILQEIARTRRTAERLDIRMVARDRAKTEALLHRSESAWHRSDATQVWRELEGQLLVEQTYWQKLLGDRAASSLLCDARFTLEQATGAYETVLLLAAAHVQTLLLIGEERAAQHHAKEFHNWHDQLLLDLTPIDIATARSRHLAEQEGLREEDARARLLRRANEFVQVGREAQHLVAQRPLLIETLQTKGIRGREYIEAVRERTDTPVLLLPVS